MADDAMIQLMDSVVSSNKEFENNYVDVRNSILQRQRDSQDLADQTGKAGIIASDGTIETPLVAAARQLSGLKAQQDARQVATALGTNPDESNYILTKLAAQWKDSAADAYKKTSDYEAKQSVKFSDNPAQWVLNQFTAGDDERAASIAVSKYNLANDQLAKAQAQTQQLQITSNSIAENRTAATVQSTLEAVQARINSNVSKVKIDNAGVNITGIQIVERMTQDQINNISTLQGALNQQGHLDVAIAHANEVKKNTELLYEDRLDKLEQRKLNEKDALAMTESFRAGASALGFTNLSALPTNKLLSMRSVDPELFKQFFITGLTSTAVGIPVISDNPADVAKIVGLMKAPLQPAQKEIANLFRETWSYAANPENVLQTKIDPTKVDQVSGYAGRLAKTKATDQMNYIKPGDATNIYSPPNLNIITSQDAIKNSELYKKVLAVQIQAGGLSEINPKQLIGLTSNAISAGTIPYNTAVTDLQALFGAARSLNNVNKNYAGLGLPQQIGFKTKLVNTFGFMTDVDLANRQDVDRVLQTELNAKKFVTKDKTVNSLYNMSLENTPYTNTDW